MIFTIIVWVPTAIWVCPEITAKLFGSILKRRYYIKYKQLLQLHKVEFSLQELLSFEAQANYQQESETVPPGTIVWIIWEVTGISILKLLKFFQFWGKQFLTQQLQSFQGTYLTRAIQLWTASHSHWKNNQSVSGITHPTKTWKKLCTMWIELRGYLPLAPWFPIRQLLFACSGGTGLLF